ncbi:transcriptional regulator PpsR [Amorphus orientalis]|uniref:Transcriptional regulator PpsR n=1 Tax=Amorphus orientalis TaxID=649198 RepID=A0AAE3VNS6_9HYPH|nr:transcriptional regulator PpsR [Amorphus orientalis]MDQ0315467.1 transcriptional regulator PpsR [Amorphus orientalis]
MDTSDSLDRRAHFKFPEETFRNLDATSFGALIATTADVVLVVDGDGVIRDVAVGNGDLLSEGLDETTDRRWIDTVTIESRPKVEEMIAAASNGGAIRWRQVNHPARDGVSIPVNYLAQRLGSDDRILVVGKEMRDFTVLQQQVVETQQSMEREYARLRQAEMRYRLLFRLASEPVLVVNAATGKVQDANPAALRVLDRTAERTNGRRFTEFFDSESARSIDRLFAALQTTGEAPSVAACLREQSAPCMVSASLFRRDETAHFLVRLALPEEVDRSGDNGTSESLQAVMRHLPDGFVVTDLDMNVLTCNESFLDIVQFATEDQVKGQSLERWLGRGSIDTSSLSASLREHGTVRNFATFIHSEYGLDEDVEITAVSVPKGEAPCLGFIVRRVTRAAKTTGDMPTGLPRSVDQLTELVGRVPLKDLVREATDVIERLCIEASLQLTHDNRASAAQMLGLSRQSFYAKLRRHGLGDLDS